MSTKRPLNLTTIIVEKSTRETLKHVARKDQTYDQLINELLKSKQGQGQGQGTEATGGTR
jgi:hypothetical protein